MKTFNFYYDNQNDLLNLVNTKDFNEERLKAKSTLIQLYCGSLDHSFYENTLNLITKTFPTAVIIGSTSIGEISDGTVEVLKTCISISFFRDTNLKSFFYELNNENDFEIGQKIVLENTSSDSKGILMFATGKGIKSYNLLSGISSINKDLVIAGGHSAIEKIFDTYIFNGQKIHNSAITGVVFDNPNLQINNYWHLSWQPIGKEMTITKSDGLRVYEIDGIPAYQIYKKYFGDKIEESFNLNAIEFPLLLQREGVELARVAVFRNKEDDSLIFYADLQVGEKVRLGFGNINIILDTTQDILNQVSENPVESIFIFSCGIRRSYMQKDVCIEIAPFKEIAPTSGFFTWGEFYGNRKSCMLLNSTLTVLAISEESKEEYMQKPKKIFEKRRLKDELGYKYASVLTNLANVANAVTTELEEQTIDLQNINATKDRLFSIIAHDLRSPFNILLGLTEFMMTRLHSYDTARLEQLLSKINACSRLAYNLTDNLLNWALSQTGELKYIPEIVNLNEIVENEIKGLRAFALLKEITINLECDNIFHAYVDPNMQRFILRNLVNNAIKFSNRGEAVNVKISAVNEHIKINVNDKGIGMTKKDIDQLLSTNHHLSTPGTEKEGGTGLGLMLCREFIEINMGSLSIESEKNKGSNIEYTMPKATLEFN